MYGTSVLLFLSQIRVKIWLNLALIQICLRYNTQYEEKYETKYETQYKKQCAAKYEQECSTKYETEYETKYKEKCETKYEIPQKSILLLRIRFIH